MEMEPQALTSIRKAQRCDDVRGVSIPKRELAGKALLTRNSCSRHYLRTTTNSRLAFRRGINSKRQRCNGHGSSGYNRGIVAHVHRTEKMSSALGSIHGKRCDCERKHIVHGREARAEAIFYVCERLLFEHATFFARQGGVRDRRKQ